MAVPLCASVCAVIVQHSFVSMGRVPVTQIFPTELDVPVFFATVQRFTVTLRCSWLGD